jgi:uracil-DNA glycosylase family 4
MCIANVIKCRPPQAAPRARRNRNLRAVLVSADRLIKPKVIVTLGKLRRSACSAPGGADLRLRGQLFDYRGAKLIPIPSAYLLRNPPPSAKCGKRQNS